MKRIVVMLLAIAMTLSLCACGQKTEVPSASALPEVVQEETQVITDTMGREVTLTKNIEKIIAVPWPWTSFVFAVDGSADKICTMSATALASYENCMFEVLAPGLADSDTGFIDDTNKDGGSFGTLNIEEIAKKDPDVVIIYKRDAETMLPVLESAGIPTVVFDFGGLEQVQQGLTLLGQMLGDEAAERAAQIIQWHNATQTMLDERLAGVNDDDKPTVLIFNSKEMRLYNSAFSNNMILQAGGKLAAVDENGAPVESADVNFEQILKWDPDYILLTNFFDGKPDDIYNNEMAGQDWSQLTAVKSGHVYKIPMGIYRWSPPNTEAHLLLTWEAKMLHPELFADISLTDMTSEFYSTLFNHDLTQDELAMIYQLNLNKESEEIALDSVA